MYNLKDYVKGWLVGDFEPSLFRSKDIEVGVKEYTAGTVEASHHHKIATEYTIVLSGIVNMLGQEFGEGDIVVIEPGVSNTFISVTDSTLLVIKTPSVMGDKYEDK